MPGPAAILREIHRLRRHARDLQDRLDELPRRLQAQQAKLTHQQEAYRQAQDDLKHLKVATHDKEVSLRTAQQQIKKYEKQLDEATAKKEYDSLKAEIQAARDKAVQLEDDVLNTMLLAEEQTAALPGREQAVQLAKAELARFEADLADRRTELEEQLRKTQQQVAEVEAGLPAGKPREDYQRLLRAYGEDALAHVEGRTCSTCYTEITTQQSQELKLEQFVLCKNCGRILYLAE